jgi:hypothetical protein
MHDIIENIKDFIEEAIKRLRFGKVEELVLVSNSETYGTAIDIRGIMKEADDYDGTPVCVSSVESITFDENDPITLNDGEVMLVEVRPRRIFNVGTFRQMA